MAYAHLEPFGPDVESLRAGQICAVVANVNRPKGHRAYKPTDFFNIESARTPERESARSIWAKAALLTEAYKAVHRTPRKIRLEE